MARWRSQDGSKAKAALVSSTGPSPGATPVPQPAALAIRRTQRRGGRVVVYVDEGISHIPFLLQESGVECRTIEAFVDEFAVQLRELHVLFLDAPAELVRERLRRRGHARIPRGDEACLARFVETSARTAECLKRRRDAFAVFDIACSR